MRGVRSTRDLTGKTGHVSTFKNVPLRSAGASLRSTQIAVLALTATALAAAALVATACLAVTPILVTPKDAGFLADASCSSCLELPAALHGCQDSLDACRANARCGDLLSCLEAVDCFDRPTIDDKLNCGVPCVTEAGITSVDDPRIVALLDVVKCGQRQCGVACNLGDAGLGLDAL